MFEAVAIATGSFEFPGSTSAAGFVSILAGALEITADVTSVFCGFATTAFFPEIINGGTMVAGCAGAGDCVTGGAFVFCAVGSCFEFKSTNCASGFGAGISTGHGAAPTE